MQFVLAVEHRCNTKTLDPHTSFVTAADAMTYGFWADQSTELPCITTGSKVLTEANSKTTFRALQAIWSWVGVNETSLTTLQEPLAFTTDDGTNKTATVLSGNEPVPYAGAPTLPQIKVSHQAPSNSTNSTL